VLTAQNAFLAFTEEASVGVEPFYAMLRASSQKKKKKRCYRVLKQLRCNTDPRFERDEILCRNPDGSDRNKGRSALTLRLRRLRTLSLQVCRQRLYASLVANVEAFLSPRRSGIIIGRWS
jgi:hypothetical protein